jgi:hypothetical protein
MADHQALFWASWCEELTQRGESGRDFRQNTQNKSFKYQLWRITKLCFVLVV